MSRHRDYVGGYQRRRNEPIHSRSRYYQTHEGEEVFKGVMGIVYAIAFGIFLGVLYILVHVLFHIFTYLSAIVENEFILAQLAALGALIGGVCLFFLREHKRMLYALLEMAVAIITGGTAISRLKDGDLYVWLALMASVYLVVRSLENMQKAGFTFISTCNDYVGQFLIAGRTKSISTSEGVKRKDETTPKQQPSQQ